MGRKSRTSIGRRPGQNKSRRQILSAAQKLIADKGYDRTTLRDVAASAGVDPALIVYFFKTKQRLFIEAILPVYEPGQNLPKLLEGDKAVLGQRLATYLVSYLENPKSRNVVVGLVRASLSEPEAAKIFKKLFVERTGTMLAAIEGIDQPELRANLAGTQYMGLVLLRYILKVEPLASAPKDVLIDYIAPTLQRYITGSLGSLDKTPTT